MLQQRSDNWLAERALIDAQLDPDLRHDVVTNLGQDTRCLLQIIRLLREAMQSAPAKR
jgi:hypothetical protein